MYVEDVSPPFDEWVRRWPGPGHRNENAPRPGSDWGHGHAELQFEYRTAALLQQSRCRFV